MAVQVWACPWLSCRGPLSCQWGTCEWPERQHELGLVPAAQQEKGQPGTLSTGRSSFCPRVWGVWPSCPAMARHQGREQPGWASAGVNPLFCRGFCLLSGGSSPKPNWERNQDAHCISMTQFPHQQHAPAPASADSGWGEAHPMLRRWL